MTLRWHRMSREQRRTARGWVRKRGYQHPDGFIPRKGSTIRRPLDARCQCGHAWSEHLSDGYCPVLTCRCLDFTPRSGPANLDY